MQVQSNLAKITREIRIAEKQFGRAPNSVDLVLVSKAQPLEKIQEAYNAGQRKFGENYLQEALEKMGASAFLRKQQCHPCESRGPSSHEKMDSRFRATDGTLISGDDTPIEWHFIGHIQSNKTKEIAENFAVVHSVASLKIAQRLNAARPLHLPPLSIFLQVNISNEASKDGVAPDEVLALAQAIQPLKQLKLRGLMCVPENTADFDSQFAAFKRVADCQNSLNLKGFSLDGLSMGMSQDFPAAIKAGSTLLRIGTAVFGPR